MIAADSVRRATVFALLFGGAVGFLAWRAGGLRSKTAGEPAGGSGGGTAPRPAGVTPVGPGLGIGTSEDGTLARDAKKVIDGKPLTFRAWTASWAKASPRKSQDPAVGVQDLVEPRVVLYPTPASANAPAVKAGDPGTTTIAAKTGVLTYEKNVRTEARLAGDVAVDRVDPVRGDFHLRTESLVSTMETHGDVDKRHAQTAAPIVIDGGRAHLAGTGLDADLSGDAVAATILRDVKGRFAAPAGSMSLTGGQPSAKSLPTDVTCSGACELVSLDAASRGQDRRWRATFHDDVHVVQGADSLDCDLLVVEFKMGETKSDDGMPAPFVVATGHVHAKGATETRTYDVVCGKATHRRLGVVGKEIDVVVFEDAPVMNMHGSLAASAALGGDPKKKASDAKADGKGRMEIRCDGAATMTTRKAGNLAVHRTDVVFEKNVVVKQWDDESVSAPTGEMRAPKATLYGTRLPSGQFQPDTLTAEDDTPQGKTGVDLKRLDFASHSDGATWTRLAEQGVDRYMLVGNPVVDYAGVAALRPFGKAKTSKDGRIRVTSADNVTLDVFDARPSDPGRPPRPFATIVAGPHVVVTQTEAGVEIGRAACDGEMRVQIAQGKQLEHLEANVNAKFRGLADDGQVRGLEGHRIVLDRLVNPPGAPKDAPHPSQVVALGKDETSQALALVEEPNGDKDDIRADSLRYFENGSVIFADGHVLATLDSKSRGSSPDGKLPKLADGPIRITAGEARIDLDPAASKTADGSRKLRKVDAGGGVVIDGKIDRIHGRQIVYDAVTGIAEVRGEKETARVVYSAESARYPSLLLADLIRAYFDVSGDPSKKGGLLRVVCPLGGRIIRYIDAPDPATGRAVPGTIPRRLQIESKGPMESTRREATAQGDVIARMWSLSKSGDFTDDPMTFYCQRVRTTFDPDAPGRAKDRVKTLDAVGNDEHQVVVETMGFFGRCDHLELDGPAATIAMSTGAGTKVYVREVSSGRQMIYDSVTYHYVTKEWTDAVGAREAESR